METSPHCFTCREHEKIGKSKKECYCLANKRLTGHKELIKEMDSGECKAWKSLERWQDKIENDLFNEQEGCCV